MFNRHKLKRKFSRTKRTYRKTRNTAYCTKKKDFAWRGKRGNPLRQSGAFFTMRVKLQFFTFFVAVMALIGVLLYNPFFHITDISIEGTQRLTNAEVLEAVHGSLEYKKFFVLPAKSYFLAGTVDIEGILVDRFPLNTVHITKKFPNTLTVILEERLSTVIYDDGSMYYFMGLTGKIVEPIQKVTDAEWRIETEIVSSTTETGDIISEEREIARYHTPDVQSLIHDVGEYPIVFSHIANGDTPDINSEVIPEGYVTALVVWYHALQSQSVLKPRYVDITNPRHTVFYTSGMSVHIDLMGESAPQITRLETALQEIDNISIVSYIDVRYAGRVYWQ